MNHKIKAKIFTQKFKSKDTWIKLCAYDGKFLSIEHIQDSKNTSNVSHGICKECSEVELAKLTKTLKQRR